MEINGRCILRGRKGDGRDRERGKEGGKEVRNEGRMEKGRDE